MSIQLPQLIGHDRLTHSRMQSFRTCRRKHWFSYELGIRPQGTSKPLRMGALIHDAIDRYCRGADAGVAFSSAKVASEGYQNEIDPVELETVSALFDGYVDRWGRSPIVVESEQAFDLPIENPDTCRVSRIMRVAGKIDRIVRLDDGRLAVLETKTVSESIDPESHYWRRLELDQQISLYMLAARQLGHDVDTVVYDVIRKPSIAPKEIPDRDENGHKIVVDDNGERVFISGGKPRQSVTADQKAMGWRLLGRMESAEEYARRLREDIASRPDFYYARREIPRLDADLEDFRHELWQQAKSIREAQRYGHWFRNTTACDWKGRCPYLDICRNARDIQGVPSGFVRVDHIHPELGADE